MHRIEGHTHRTFEEACGQQQPPRRPQQSATTAHVSADGQPALTFSTDHGPVTIEAFHSGGGIYVWHDGEVRTLTLSELLEAAL